MPEKQLSLFERFTSFKIKKPKASTKKTKKRSQGDIAEELACLYLQKQGLTLIKKKLQHQSWRSRFDYARQKRY